MIVPNPAEVHLWLVDFAGARPDEMLQDLDAGERAQASTFGLAARRDAFVHQRAALRRLLGAYLNHTPSLICLRRSATGKPSLDQPGTQLSFNLSHSGPHMLVGVTSRREIGVDVQVITPGTRCLALAQRFFSSAEHDYLRSVPTSTIERAFFDLWTLKEAWLKCTGAGISGGLHRFTIDASADQPRLGWVADGSTATQWHLRRVPIATDVCAALAVTGDERVSLQIRRWHPAAGPPMIE